MTTANHENFLPIGWMVDELGYAVPIKEDDDGKAVKGSPVVIAKQVKTIPINEESNWDTFGSDEEDFELDVVNTPLSKSKSKFSPSGFFLPDNYEIKYIDANPADWYKQLYITTTTSTWAIPSTANIQEMKELLGLYNKSPSEKPNKEGLQEVEDSASVEGMATPTLVPVPDSVQSTLPRIYKHSKHTTYLVCMTGESIWTKDSSILILNYLENCHTIIDPNGKSKYFDKWFTEKKATKAGWVKVAEGPSIKLPKLPIAETLTDCFTAGFNKNKKFSDLTKIEFILAANNIIHSVVSPNTPFEDPITKHSLYDAWQSIYSGKQYFDSKLSPSEKGKLTVILNQINYLYLLADLWARFNYKYFYGGDQFNLVDEAIIDTYDKIMGNTFLYQPYDKNMYLRSRLNKYRELFKYPINPFKASFTEITEFAKTIDVKYIEIFNELELRNWVACKIKWPELEYDLDSIEEIIRIKFLMSKIVDKSHQEKVSAKVPSILDFKEYCQQIPTVSGAQTILINGSEVIIEHVALASLSSTGEIRIYKGGSYYKIVDGEKTKPVELWCSASKAHAMDIAEGWQDITPNWVNSKKFPSQPPNVDSGVINFILNCQYGGKEFAELLGEEWLKKTDSEIENWIYDSTAYDAEQCLRILAARESIRKLAAWAEYIREFYHSFSLLLNKAESIINSIKYLARIGTFIHADTSIWNCSELSKDFVVPPDSNIYRIKDGDSISYFIRVNEKTYLLDVSSGNMKRFPYGISKAEKNLVFTAPPNLALDKANAEGWEFTEDVFNSVLAAESQDWSLEIPEKAAAYYYKLAIGDNNNYSGLVNKIYSFPSGIKQLVMLAAQEGNFSILDVVLWRVSKGAYAAALLEEKIDPTAPYYIYVKKGMIGVEDISNNWDISLVSKFLDDFHVVYDPNGALTEKISAVASKLLEIKKAAAVSAVSDASLDTANLDLTPISLSFGGMHTKQAYADQFGNTWMAKFYASDPNAQYRCDAEHYGNVIGRTLGFNSALTFVRVIDGNYNVLQRIEPTPGTLKDVNIKNLNLPQLISLMEEHVLDWLISNHDSWGDNILFHPNNKEIIGIDKGQAFKHCHDDRLAIGYLPRENPIPVLYDQIYNGILTGTISPEVATQIVARVLLKAYQVKTRQNERVQSLVEAALSKRSKWPDGHDKISYVNLIMNRKASILDDFASFYKEIFAQAGIVWTIDVDSFGKNIGDAFVSNSCLFADAVRNATAYGVSLFFSSKDLEDSHIVCTPMIQKNGGTCLLGSAKIRKDADAELTAWLKARLNEKVSATAKKNSEAISSDLPYLNMFISALVHLIKTIKTHKEDGNYNSEVISNVEMYKKTIEKLVADIDEARSSNPLKCLEIFSSLEQQDVWATEATILLSYYDIILEAKEAKKSVSEYYPNFPTLDFPFYKPTEGLVHKSASKLTLYEVDGDIYGKTSDGGYVAKEKDKYVWFNKEEFNLTVPNDAIPISVADSGESEQDVQIAGKQMQVARRKAAQHGGKMDLVSGKLIKHSKSSNILQTGYEYTVTYDDINIYYRPWNEEGVFAAQQGQLGFEISNWDGGYEALDDVLDTLGLMGINVTPADALSLELFYWRQITNIIADRMEIPQTQKILQYVGTSISENSKLSEIQELEILKKAWSSAYSDKVVENAKWFPRFNKYLGMVGGRPYWTRPDCTIDQLKNYYVNYLPSHSVSNLNSSTLNLILSGSLMSTEERPRVLGLEIHGASSVADQKKGSSAFVFLRQNSNISPSSSHPIVILDPIVALRTTSYAFSTDLYGSLGSRKSSAPFNPEEMYKFCSDNNELMVKNFAPIMLVVVNDKQSQISLISSLKEAGHAELNGWPIEECILDYMTYEDNRSNIHDKIWKHVLKREQEIYAIK